MNPPITLALTGASGMPYALRLIQALVEQQYSVYLMISSAAKVVLATESGLKLGGKPERMAQALCDHLNISNDLVSIFADHDWFSPVASGSAAPKQMVICPCSTGTLSSVALGSSNNLIERAADVVIKERGQLLMLVREMPLSSIHLEHMLKLSQLGVTVMPAAPGFYHQPQSIDDLVDFVVARVLDHLGLSQNLAPKWGYDPKPD